MRVGDLSPVELRGRMRRGDLRYHMGPFVVALESPLGELAALFQHVYPDTPLAEAAGIADFHVRIAPGSGTRRWLRAQARFTLDGGSPFAPFPREQALALLEWGLNWCVATRANQYLLLHSAVVERHGQAFLLPAWPASGKTTLCAALVSRGWRLFSDEFGIVELLGNRLVPMPRCLALKNASIEVIRRFAPEARIGPVFPHTRKGDVAHLGPPRESVERADETAPARYVVFPAYGEARGAALKPLTGARAFMKLAGNSSFNYELLGARGFRTVARIIDESECYLFHYDDLDAAVATLEDLAARSPEPRPSIH